MPALSYTMTLKWMQAHTKAWTSLVKVDHLSIDIRALSVASLLRWPEGPVCVMMHCQSWSSETSSVIQVVSSRNFFKSSFTTRFSRRVCACVHRAVEMAAADRYTKSSVQADRSCRMRMRRLTVERTVDKRVRRSVQKFSSPMTW